MINWADMLASMDNTVDVEEVGKYLRFLKHKNALVAPLIQPNALALACAIANELSDIDDFGLKNKYKPLFSGAKTFHRNRLGEVSTFFTQNKANVLAASVNIVETRFSGRYIDFARLLGNYYHKTDEVLAAFHSLFDDNAVISHQQKTLKETMLANLLWQILVQAENDYYRWQTSGGVILQGWHPTNPRTGSPR